MPVDDVVAGLPVREFRSYKGRQHYSGWCWSATLRRLVAYESWLELARIMLADFDSSVAGLAAQPSLLTGADDPGSAAMFLACYRREAFIAASLIPAVLAAAAEVPLGGAIERELSREHSPVLVRPVVLHLLWLAGCKRT